MALLTPKQLNRRQPNFQWKYF